MAQEKKKNTLNQQVETRKFDAETDKVFRLMIHSLYQKKEIFLRELVSNASDACDKLRYLALSDETLLDGQKELEIRISVNDKAHSLTITDTGIGMNKEELIANLGTIARSGTQAFLEGLEAGAKKESQLIGQFGVGFYSAFMVADRIEVTSRKAGDSQGYSWTSRGDGSYQVGEAQGDVPRGTQITLNLKKDEQEYTDLHRLEHILSTYSGHVAFPVYLEGERVNEGTALWRKSPKEVTQEEYTDFYRSLSHFAADTPWLTIHNRVEGALEYTNLLFIPGTRPFDLYHPDRKTQVKLYIKRVFIAEEGVELLPRYLRFLRGVIDSEDLPLNISRESIQNSRVVANIRSALTKKILSELMKKADKEPEAYQEFWNLFGPVLKEGLCDGMEPRDEILNACRFASTVSETASISLKAYKERRKEGQTEIFYLTGEDYASTLISPQLEGFKARGIEVLLLTDSVDEFWVNVVSEFDGTPLRSITRGTLDLDSIVPLEKTEETRQDDAQSEQVKETLVPYVKSILSSRLQDVRITSKLTDSPACLSAPDGAMDIRMERFMLENKQLQQAMPKVLELNPKHPLIQWLAEHQDHAQAEDMVHLIYAQAALVEGEPLPDMAGFTRRMNSLLMKATA